MFIERMGVIMNLNDFRKHLNLIESHIQAFNECIRIKRRELVINKQKILFKNKHGSFCLELSLVFPMFLILIMFFVWNMAATRSEMLFKNVINKESEKVSFMGALGEFSSVIAKSNLSENIKENDIELIINETYFQVLKSQINTHYKTLCAQKNSYLSLIKSHDEYLEYDAFNNSLKMTSCYELYTPFSTIKKLYTITLRPWDHGDQSGTIGGEDDKSIWQYDNFKRGILLRKRFGGNLPIGFPVLSGYSNGNALIIKSLDITLPTWQNDVYLADKMISYIDELTNYKGMNYPWGEKKIQILYEDINNRFIKFIIPENYDSIKYSPVFNKISSYGVSRNIQIEIIPYQKSQK